MEATAVDFRSPGPVRLLNTLVTHRIADVTDFAELVSFVRERRKDNPSERVLVTLDDLDQCAYTSGHAGADDRLAHDVDYPLDGDPLRVNAWEVAALAHVAERLDAPELRVSWGELATTRETDNAAVEALSAVNQTPTEVLDGVLHLMSLPVERDDLVIAGLPNGYFTADWDTFQNHAVMRRLQERFGYRLFGLGASWLGFERDGVLTPTEAVDLIGDLQHLYGARQADAWSALGAAVQRHEWLLLGYTEGFAE